MGHIRLGRLPKTRAWSQVFQLLQGNSITPGQLASSISMAAEEHLASLETDEGINYCFWVLVRIATAARGDDFVRELERLGVPTSRISSGLTFVQHLGRAVEKELAKREARTVFVRMAELSLKEVVSAGVIEESRSLFGTGLKEIQSACRAISTQKRFGEAAKAFFAKFMGRSIQFLTDKELSNYVDSQGILSSPQHVSEFQQRLSRYCFETAKIVEEFAAGWFSKHNWESNNDIPEDAAAAFTSYALAKLQAEFRESRG